MRPGLTGLWQVSRHTECPRHKRAALDVLYVRNWYLLLDMIILAMTVPAVLAQHGSCKALPLLSNQSE
jgi:exopolysaccharide production protein ExoY